MDVAGVVVAEGVKVGENVERLERGGDGGGLEDFGAAFLEGFDLREDLLGAGRGGDGDEIGEGELERGRDVGDGVAGVEESGQNLIEVVGVHGMGEAERRRDGVCSLAGAARWVSSAPPGRGSYGVAGTGR